MRNETYDKLKLIALIVAPVVVFLSTICNVWHIAYAEQICATLSALDVLFGSIVVIAKKHYDDENNSQ